MMPCRFIDVISCKVVSLYPENGKRNLPTHIVYVVLFEAQSGRILGILVCAMHEGRNIVYVVYMELMYLYIGGREHN